MTSPLLALKVDVDTYEGMRRGVPRLLDLFREKGVRATFFFAYGPDNSGKAIWNVFRQRGFLLKMLRTRALGMYGWRTALSGTLLPARVIGAELKEIVCRTRDEGHEVGAHGWDHRLWQDHLEKLSRRQVAGEIRRAVAAQESLLGNCPASFAAPAWMVSDAALEELDRHEFLYTSCTRFGEPFYPRVGGRVLRTLEIPSTGLCPEELVAAGCRNDLFPPPITGSAVPVFPAHAEVEGGVLLRPFREWLSRFLDTGGSCIPLEEVARSALAAGDAVPGRTVELVSIPGRAGRVATGYPGWKSSREGEGVTRSCR